MAAIHPQKPLKCHIEPKLLKNCTKLTKVTLKMAPLHLQPSPQKNPIQSKLGRVQNLTIPPFPQHLSAHRPIHSPQNKNVIVHCPTIHRPIKLFHIPCQAFTAFYYYFLKRRKLTRHGHEKRITQIKKIFLVEFHRRIE